MRYNISIVLEIIMVEWYDETSMVSIKGFMLCLFLKCCHLDPITNLGDVGETGTDN